MSVSPFRKMSLKCFWSFVDKISTDFAVVGYIKAMEFVKPVRNWFPIPTKWQVFGIIWSIILVILVWLIFGFIVFRIFSLNICSCLFTFNILLGSCPLL